MGHNLILSPNHADSTDALLVIAIERPEGVASRRAVPDELSLLLAQSRNGSRVGTRD